MVFRRNYCDGGEENIDVVWIPKSRPGTFIWSPSAGVTRTFTIFGYGGNPKSSRPLPTGLII